eukprot:9103300-Pyramimonas_sp.AAC.1
MRPLHLHIEPQHHSVYETPCFLITLAAEEEKGQEGPPPVPRGPLVRIKRAPQSREEEKEKKKEEHYAGGGGGGGQKPKERP